jgi:hypothetical protein
LAGSPADAAAPLAAPTLEGFSFNQAGALPPDQLPPFA